MTEALTGLQALVRSHMLLTKKSQMEPGIRAEEHLPPVFLPGEESSRHEEAVQAPEVQPPEGGEAREEGQQRGLGNATAGQGQALQLWSQAHTHLKRDATQTRSDRNGHRWTGNV